jgi:sulfoquinovose isomerase
VSRRLEPLRMPQPDPERPGGQAWLTRETVRLLEFAAASRLPGTGFGWLDETGHVEGDRPVELYITGRMAHVFALAVLENRDEYAPLLQHGVDSLRAMRDEEYGGWYARIGPDGPLPVGKGAYEHSFVVLAGASATVAGHPLGPALLADGLDVVRQHFLDGSGMVVDQWDDRFDVLDPYRGVNANMHWVEAFLAAADATDEQAWVEHARTITERVIGFAASNGWRIPEHFDPQWQPLLEYNADRPRDQFRPYGATIGHSLEWARLILHLRTALGDAAPSLLEDAARALFDQSVRDGWAVDGATGLVYTVDWGGAPVVHERMHWVVAEGINTAAALFAVTGDEIYQEWYDRWWRWADEFVVDRVHGSWRHELDRTNHPSATVWEGKPDAYHAVQATIVPRCPLGVSVAGSLAGRPENRP